MRTKAAIASLFVLQAVLGAAPADLDRDGDVDSADFGLFQACWTGENAAQLAPPCQIARLDDDSDVD